MEVACETESRLRTVSLLYHDVIDGVDWDSSGFTGPGTAKYKLTRADFEAHLASIAATGSTPITVSSIDATRLAHDVNFLLTFDDGGVSAAATLAGSLGPRGWLGHFFVTTGQIGKSGFLNREQIVELHKQGHVIGSHSSSHPMRMSYCSREELLQEWTSSLGVLSEILGEPVVTASVPGGYYSRRVGEAAATAGIRVLFTSEPTTRIHSVLGCLVVGRFNIFRGMPPHISGDLISSRPHARLRQWMHWNVKKLAKKVAGRPYLAARQSLLRNS